MIGKLLRRPFLLGGMDALLVEGFSTHYLDTFDVAGGVHPIAYGVEDVLRTYPIGLGFAPTGHKQFEGDGKREEVSM